MFVGLIDGFKNFFMSGYYMYMNDMCYLVMGLDCECVNGQVVLQFVLIKELKFMFDYMGVVNIVKFKNIENLVWFGFLFFGVLNGLF